MNLAQFDYPQEISVGLSGGAVAGIVIFAIVSYLFIAYCLYRIAKKFDMEYPWLAFIPFANLWLMAKMAGYGGGWFLLFIVPFANIVFVVIVWWKIAGFLGKENVAILYGILMLIPIANYIAIAILAFSERAVLQPSAGLPLGQAPSGSPPG